MPDLPDKKPKTREEKEEALFLMLIDGSLGELFEDLMKSLSDSNQEQSPQPRSQER
jgi:hypothetical protein